MCWRRTSVGLNGLEGTVIVGLAILLDERIQPQWAVQMESRINKQLGRIMATLQEILAAIAAWGTSWRDVALAERARADAAVAGLTDAQAAAQASADALAQYQADDAATDAAQIAAQAQADADTAQETLDEVLALDVPPAPSENPPVVEEPAE